MAPVGMHLVAQAARHHAVPFVVLVGIYKLTPLFAHEPGLNFNELKSPDSILPYTDGALLAAGRHYVVRLYWGWCRAWPRKHVIIARIYMHAICRRGEARRQRRGASRGSE